MMRLILVIVFFGTFPVLGQEVEGSRHRIELNGHWALNTTMLMRVFDHMDENGFGATSYIKASWLFGTPPDSTLYPRINRRGRLGFSGYYGYQVKEKYYVGLTGGYTSLGSVEGHTVDSSYATIGLDQWFVIPTVRYQPVRFFDVTAGLGLAGNRSILRNTDTELKYNTSPTLAYYIQGDLILQPEQSAFYWKLGLSYIHTHDTSIGPYTIGENTFPELKMGYNYFSIHLTVLGVKL